MGRGAGETIAAPARRGSRDQVLAGLKRMDLPAAYEVGGCVRDELLGREPKDIDVAVCGLSFDELLARANAEGRAKALTVAGKQIGVRLQAPWTDAEGIELALARTEVSTGASRHQFAIVTSADLTIEQDLARRDFTCNAIARDIETGELIDPYNGAQDIRDGLLRTVSDRSFPEDPLRVLRGLARCAKDGLRPDERTFEQMREWARDPKRYLRESAPQIINELLAKQAEDNRAFEAKHGYPVTSNAELGSQLYRAGVLDENGNVDQDKLAAWARTAVDEPGRTRAFFESQVTGYRWYGDVPLSPERVSGELNKILSGRHAADALRIARDADALHHIVPELKDMVGFEQRSSYHDMTVDEHTLTVLERACEADASPRVRMAALLHDSGKPASAWQYPEDHKNYAKEVEKFGSPRLHYFSETFKVGDGEISFPDHEEVSDAIADGALTRLRTPDRDESAIRLLVREHMYRDDTDFEARGARKQTYKARRFIERVGRDNVEDLLLLRRCDRAGKGPEAPPGWLDSPSRFEEVVREQMSAPLTVKELAINGRDILELGIKPGPEIGEISRELLDRVIVNPEDNNRERLLKWAASLGGVTVEETE